MESPPAGRNLSGAGGVAHGSIRLLPITIDKPYCGQAGAKRWDASHAEGVGRIL